ncbi:variant erythrocyte surface antigen-1 family protein [Babesia caballi]|uniref:Variant erythrocyte surface antigen-1 family protein n=1 Tax=Babesia caballi TaxID=5871 RepID=A0AAV4LY75_BABCB|nr:variant erythrocyte surface antigen-1 family protein [Babesia caballi]
MIFSTLSYLYWRCSDGDFLNGGWKDQQFNGIDALKNFMLGSGYKSSELNYSMYGSQVVSEAMKDTYFKDFSTGLQAAKQAGQNRANKEDAARITLKIGKSRRPPTRTGHPGDEAPSNNNATSREYIHELCGKWCKEPFIFTHSDDKPLSALYYVSYLYFNAKQSALSNDPDFEPRPPSTIREMLYFLAAQPFSDSYNTLDTYISDHFKSLVNNSAVSDDAELMIPVADASSVNTNNTLSAADFKNYLITTCQYAITLLSVIQGNSGSENSGEPWLHELYSNGLNFTYPSDSGLLIALSNYAYAIQFQLYFLYTQCSVTYTEGCGWNQCQYGSEINKNLSNAVLSHICEGFKCNGVSGCNHQGSSNQCNHNKKGQGCGKSSNSPLQAFLTDNLQGFTHSLPGSPNHLDNHPPSSLCHVKMGFSGKLRPNPRKGNLISITLQSFCGSLFSPLRQLSEKLGCLTKRTPRTFGDLFGFIWHLNGQLFNKDNIVDQLRSALSPNHDSVEDFIGELTQSLTQVQPQSLAEDSGLVKSLQFMAPAIPFLYKLFTVNRDKFLPVTLFNLAQHCHKVEVKSGNGFIIVHKNPSNSVVTSGHDCSSSPNDLWSICQPVNNNRNHSDCVGKSCGGYLEPLTHTFGSAFAPKYASSYLSWFLHLTDDLEAGLRDMLEDFRNVDCKTSGSPQKDPAKSSIMHSPKSSPPTPL